MIRTSDIHWLAGLLEGEGTFIVYNKLGTTSKTFFIQVGSSDYDVMLRVHRLFVTPSSISQHKSKIRDGHIRKIHYRVTVHNNRAIQWMMTLLPLMGQRRQAKIKELIQEWKEYKPWNNKTKKLEKSK